MSMNPLAKRRICRTCPAVLSVNNMRDQCAPCWERSKAVVKAVGANPPPRRLHLREQSCGPSGHAACPHYRLLRGYLQTIVDEAGVCPACGAILPDEADEDEAIEHGRECPLFVLDLADATQRETG